MNASLPSAYIYPDLDVRSRRGWLLGWGVMLSVLLHLSVLVVLYKLNTPRKGVEEQVHLRIQIRAEESPAVEIPSPEPEIAEPQEIEELPDAVATPPPVEQKPDPPPMPTSPSAAPPKSVLQMVDDYLATEDLPAVPPADTGPHNIFHPELRRALGGPKRQPGGNPLLNNSTIGDTQERVALDGKCFRLEDLGGGGDRRAWYRVTCNGKETPLEAMARGLMEALERRR